MDRIKAAIAAVLIGLLILAVMVIQPVVVRSADAAVTIYGVAQSGDEADFTAWLGGVYSRGIGNFRMQTGRVTFDSSYPTGGETLDLSSYFPNKVLFCIAQAAAGYTFEYVHAASDASATGTLRAYTAASTTYETNDPLPAALEVKNTGDMSSVTTHYFAVGY